MNQRHSRVPRAIALAASVTLLAGCTGAGSSASATEARASVPSVTAAIPTATTSPSPATATPAPLAALKLLWDKSGPNQPSPCCQTWWPAIDPLSGNIWVADSFASQYWIFSPTGAFVGAWGTPGSAPGDIDLNAHRAQAQASGGIAFAPDGSFYVADVGNHRVDHFDAHRRLILTWGSFGSGDGQFAEPFGLATDGHIVYVADDDRGDIQAFDPTGQFLRAFGPIEQNAGIFIAIAPDGTLYRAAGEGQANAVLRYDAAGNVAATIDTGLTDGFVAGLAIDPHGNLFVNVGHADAAGHQLIELDATGRRVAAWSTGGETGVVDPSGKAIYLASDGNATWPKASLRKYALP